LCVIDLLLLGNGSMQPLPDRWLSSLLIRCGTELVLFDCGEGTQIVYRKFGWGFRKLSTIILSHIHADHVAGLPGILLCIANAERTEPVAIFGPAGIRRVVEALRVLCPYLPFELHIHELASGDQVSLPGGMRGSVVAGMHGEMPVLAWRFDLARRPRFDRDAAEALGVPQTAWRQLQSGEAVAWNERVIEPEMVTGPTRPGISFGIITDTRPRETFADVMRGVDLLVCEATYLDDVDLHKALMFGHMTMDEACAIATDAGAKRLLLTHFSATYEHPLDHAERARACFPATDLGFSGWTTTLSYPDE
jgi:ribonuclease Z